MSHSINEVALPLLYGMGVGLAVVALLIAAALFAEKVLGNRAKQPQVSDAPPSAPRPTPPDFNS